jgi:uncharacterized protein (DUF2267 family)
MKQDEFMTKVGQRADVSLSAAEALTAATLQTLAERISGGEAQDLAAQLPEELKPHLTGADEPAQPFDAEEFVRRVVERSGIDSDRARAAIRAVFTTVREAVAPGEFDDVTAQLPKNFQELVGAS